MKAHCFCCSRHLRMSRREDPSSAGHRCHGLLPARAGQGHTDVMHSCERHSSAAQRTSSFTLHRAIRLQPSAIIAWKVGVGFSTSNSLMAWRVELREWRLHGSCWKRKRKDGRASLCLWLNRYFLSGRTTVVVVAVVVVVVVFENMHCGIAALNQY